MRPFLYRDNSAKERDPDKQPAGKLLRDSDPGIEDVAQDDVAQNERNHQGQRKDHDESDESAVAIDEAAEHTNNP
jgi:hypothetical protein